MFYLRDQAGREASTAPPPAALFDFALPDALLRTREAALLALRPALKARGRGLNEYQAQFLRILAGADGPLTIAEIRRRLVVCESESFKLAYQLVALGYVEWRKPDEPHRAKSALQPPRRIAIRDIARRQINHIYRDVAEHMSWDALAVLPPETRISERMRQRMFALLTKLRRASQREPVLDGANEPDDAGEDRAFGLALQLRRTRTALIERIKPSLRKYQFTEPQWRILRILAQHEGLGYNGQQIVRRGCFRFGSTAVPHGLVYLSQRGLVQRKELDGKPPKWRAWQPQKHWPAEITPNGRDIIRMVETHMKIECADLFERLDAHEMMQLDRLLGRLTGALLWRDGAPEDEQDTHPFAADYHKFAAINDQASKAHKRQNRILKENGLPIRTKTVTRWWA